MHCLIINNANATMNNGETGSSIELEGFSRRLRLSTVKRLARNLGNPKSVALDNPHVASEFMPASGGNGGEQIVHKRLYKTTLYLSFIFFMIFG